MAKHPDLCCAKKLSDQPKNKFYFYQISMPYAQEEKYQGPLFACLLSKYLSLIFRSSLLIIVFISAT